MLLSYSQLKMSYSQVPSDNLVERVLEGDVRDLLLGNLEQELDCLLGRGVGSLLSYYCIFNARRLVHGKRVIFCFLYFRG